MRSAAYALAWEFWSANRRGWLVVLAAIPLCALALSDCWPGRFKHPMACAHSASCRLRFR